MRYFSLIIDLFKLCCIALFINYLVSVQSAYRKAVEQATIPASYYQTYAYNQQKQRKKNFFTSATYTTRAMLETLKSWFEESPDKPARY